MLYWHPRAQHRHYAFISLLPPILHLLRYSTPIHPPNLVLRILSRSNSIFASLIYSLWTSLYKRVGSTFENGHARSNRGLQNTSPALSLVTFNLFQGRSPGARTKRNVAKTIIEIGPRHCWLGSRRSRAHSEVTSFGAAIDNPRRTQSGGDLAIQHCPFHPKRAPLSPPAKQRAILRLFRS